VSKMKKKIHVSQMKWQTGASAATEKELHFRRQERERARLLRLKEEAGKPKQVQPRIFNAVSFVSSLLEEVTTCKCPACGKKILPSEPKHISKIPPKMKAERLHCGHFYHKQCLIDYLSKPPFDNHCHVCQAEISLDYVGNRAQLEKRWAKEQERAREESDFMSMFEF